MDEKSLALSCSLIVLLALFKLETESLDLTELTLIASFLFRHARRGLAAINRAELILGTEESVSASVFPSSLSKLFEWKEREKEPIDLSIDGLCTSKTYAKSSITAFISSHRLCKSLFSFLVLPSASFHSLCAESIFSRSSKLVASTFTYLLAIALISALAASNSCVSASFAFSRGWMWFSLRSLVVAANLFFQSLLSSSSAIICMAIVSRPAFAVATSLFNIVLSFSAARLVSLNSTSVVTTFSANSSFSCSSSSFLVPISSISLLTELSSFSSRSFSRSSFFTSWFICVSISSNDVLSCLFSCSSLRFRLPDAFKSVVAESNHLDNFLLRFSRAMFFSSSVLTSDKALSRSDVISLIFEVLASFSASIFC
mmetsp:Transcript_35010/g.49693  ORF Transcript_35010/g.49693 Transcript_35010/m.49693 type:complete len:372 (+) Transcript_35010:568-1683(+)